MRNQIFLALLGAGLGLAVLSSSPAAPPVNAERIEKLIADLGSTKIDVREAASRELATLGKHALEGLRKAAKSGDLETQRRAEELVKRIEGKQYHEKALAATTVRWKFKDKPVLEAIAEIFTQTGFLMSYVDDPEKVKGRTVTLDTGETTFWQAFDQFCKAANLREVYANAAQARAVVQPANAITPAVGPYRQLSLIDDKSRGLPTDYVGAMRIRILPPEMEIANGPPRANREQRVVLDLSPEPRVEFQRVMELRIEKAVDDKGQTLTEIKTAALNANVQANVAAAVVVNQRALGRQMPVRLEAGAQAARTLKELKGTILATLRTAPQVLATVENLLAASGKTVKGEQGVSITVTDVKKLNDGGVALQITLERPTEIYAYIPPASAGGLVLPVQAAPNQNPPIQIQPIQIKPGAIQLRPIQNKPVQVQPVPLPQAVPPKDQALPPQAVPPGVPPNAAPAQQPGQPQVLPAQPAAGVVGRPNILAYVGLSVQDAKDQKIVLSDVSSKGRVTKGVYTYEVSMTARPRAGQGEPVKLLFTGTRMLSLEIPFNLKDVPLP